MKFSTSTKKLLWRLSPSLYQKLGNSHPNTEFSIGVIAGTKLSTLHQTSLASTPVLTRASVTDTPAVFVADPFVIEKNGMWHMFFEIMNHLDYLGCIGHATSTDGKNWDYDRVVLKQPFHLAYPHVFEEDNQIYLIPDSFGNGVRLYRANIFPNKWTFDSTLISNEALCDSSLLHHNGRWWMFSCERIDRVDALKIHYSDKLHGPWHEHCAGRITQPRDQRPAGRVVKVDGRIFRFIQNSEGNYGSYIRMREVKKLTTTEFVESEDSKTPLFQASGTGWNADGIHHVDLCFQEGHSFLATVDGIRRS